MRFRTARKAKDWHNWFAWYPVKLTVDNAEVVWLQTVERRFVVTNGMANVNRWTEYKLCGQDVYGKPR